PLEVVADPLAVAQRPVEPRPPVDRHAAARQEQLDLAAERHAGTGERLNGRDAGRRERLRVLGAEPDDLAALACRARHEVASRLPADERLVLLDVAAERRVQRRVDHPPRPAAAAVELPDHVRLAVGDPLDAGVETGFREMPADPLRELALLAR